MAANGGHGKGLYGVKDGGALRRVGLGTIYDGALASFRSSTHNLACRGRHMHIVAVRGTCNLSIESATAANEAVGKRHFRAFSSKETLAFPAHVSFL